MCSDLLLTNTIISLLLWDNEVASVLFPLPSAILNKDVPTTAAVTANRAPRTRAWRSSEVTQFVIDKGQDFVRECCIRDISREETNQLELSELKMQFQDACLTPRLRVIQPL